MGLFQPAVKAKLKARVAIDGPTGSGKTWTALQWARVLAGPTGAIGLVDTENRSAAYYAPTPGVAPARVNWWDAPYEFGHLPKSPPYDPRELRALILAAGDELGPEGVLVIDSLTHYWNGEGGTLDVVDNAASRGNSFTGWKEGTPAQRGMLDAIIHAPCHVIVTMRSKMEYILVETQKNGRTYTEPTKVGMAPEQRAGVEYEFTIVADMDLEHRLVVSKSRCDLVADVVAPKGRSAEVAQTFAAWLDTGVEQITEPEAATIVARFAAVADPAARSEAKRLFNAEFGLVAHLTTDKLPAVTAWLESVLAPLATLPAGEAPAPPVPGEAPVAPEASGGPDPADSEGAAAEREAYQAALLGSGVTVIDVPADTPLVARGKAAAAAAAAAQARTDAEAAEVPGG